MTQADISEELPDYIDTDDMDEEGGDEGGQLYEHYRVVADKANSCCAWTNSCSTT